MLGAYLRFLFVTALACALMHELAASGMLTFVPEARVNTLLALAASLVVGILWMLGEFARLLMWPSQFRTYAVQNGVQAQAVFLERDMPRDGQRVQIRGWFGPRDGRPAARRHWANIVVHRSGGRFYVHTCAQQAQTSATDPSSAGTLVRA